MRFKSMLVIGTVLASLVVATLADEETLSGADSNTISVLDPRKLTRSTSNINAAAINSLTGSSSPQSADGKSNDTTLIFATHVTEPAPQLENHEGLTNQLGQTVYLQAQPQQQHHQHPQQQLPSQQQHAAGQFLYPQPAPGHSNNLGPQSGPLNAPGASPPYLLHPGYGVQYVQYVPRPVVMPNYPPPPSVYGQHPSQYSNLPFGPPAPHHHSPHHHYHSHAPGIIPTSAQFILPPPPGHHSIPSVNSYSPQQQQHQHQYQSLALQPGQNQQTSQQAPSHHHHHHPQTHFLAGPQSPQSPPVAQPTSTYVSGSAVGQQQQQAQSQQQPQPQLHQQHQSQYQSQALQGQGTTQPSSYLTYSSPSHHYHLSQQINHQTPNPTAQSSNVIPNHVQPPQQNQHSIHQQQAPLQVQGHQQLIGSYSHQAPLYSYVQSPQEQRYSEPTDSFLNTNEYLPAVHFDHSQYRPIKRNSKA